MTTGTRQAGEFCWINMLTPRPAEARAFFGQVLGWTYAEIPGVGHTVAVGGHPIGGLFDLAGPQTPPGTEAHIGVMVKVQSADAAGARVASLGGRARPAFDITDMLRMTVCTDPDGVEFDVWEPRAGHGTDVDSTWHGAPSWFEALTTDGARATRFYSALFGWTPHVVPMPGGAYTVFKRGDASVAGLMEITPRMGGLKPEWKTYFTVRDADEAMRTAVALGAALAMELRDIPGGGRIGGLVSPQGVRFSIVAGAG